jgi:hypothetical protein
MRPVIKKCFVFITKSLLWSVLLYVVFMFAFNWDEVSNTVSGRNAIAVSDNQSSPQFPGTGSPVVTPAGITGHSSIIKSILAIAKTITGAASIYAER